MRELTNTIMEVLRSASASKVVLILLSMATVVGLFTGHITEDTFKVALLMVLTYYFVKNGKPQDTTDGK